MTDILATIGQIYQQINIEFFTFANAMLHSKSVSVQPISSLSDMANTLQMPLYHPNFLKLKFRIAPGTF